MKDAHYYILSGLGADERVFQNINLPENHTHIQWIENSPNEELASYAAKIAKKITHPNPILIGLSFGGIIAQEIAAQIPINKIILISSITKRTEIPWYLRLVGKTNVIQQLPNLFFSKPNMVVAYAFSLTSNKHKQILKSCFENTSPAHVKWALDKIVNWEGVSQTAEIVRIHGKNDRLFTQAHIQADFVINGGHFAIYTHSNEINGILINSTLMQYK